MFVFFSVLGEGGYMTHSTVRKWQENSRYYFIITAKVPKRTLAF